MKKTLLISALASFALSANAQTFDLDVKSGNVLQKTLHLEKNDVVMLHTSLEVGQPFQVFAEPKEKSDDAFANFNFISSLGGVTPERHGEITDLVFAGANPGWVSYTFVGENSVDAVFNIRS